MKALALMLLLVIAMPYTALARGSTSVSRSGSFSAPHAAGPATRGNTVPTTRGTFGSRSSNFSRGSVVGPGNQPNFRGYTPPFGSTIFNRPFSITDLLFWSYIFNHDSHQTVLVQQPDGKTVSAKTDTIDWIYWIDMGLLIVFVLAAIGGVVYVVNKLTQPKHISHVTD